VTKRESLSALIDGEASEIEINRLVREFKSDDSLTTSWLIYEQIRKVVRAERGGLGVDYHKNLFDRIGQAVEAEDEYENHGNRKRVLGSVVAGSLAISACLAIAVFIGVQRSDLDDLPDVVRNVTESREILAEASDTQTSELVELDEDKQRRLRAYLNQHDRMSRMNSNTQLVKYKDHDGN